MMTRILLIISLCCSVNFSHAQDRNLVREMTDNILQIRQKPGTERKLKDYLHKIKNDNDTIYAAMFCPTICRRCESFIPAFHKLLKKTIGKNMLLITVYKYKDIATKYNEENKFMADYYIYDTQNEVADIFSFNMHEIQCVYILKIKKSTGELLTGGAPTELSPDFIRQLESYNGKMENKIFGNTEDTVCEDDTPTILPKTNLTMTAFKDYRIETNGNPISSMYEIPNFESNYLFFNDNLTNCIMLYTADKDILSFKSRIKPDSLERKAFVEIPDKDFKELENNQQVFYIPLSSGMKDSKHIAISYSLPHIIFDTITAPGTGSTAYYNSPAILIRNVNTLEKGKMIKPDFSLYTDSFLYKHFTFTFFKDYIIFPCQQLTWPMDFSRDDYENDPMRDPFDKRYYDKQNPYMAIFGIKDGKLRARFGNLPEFCRESLTGYFYNTPVAYADKEELIYTDGYSGKLYVTKNPIEKNEHVYSVFDFNTNDLPRPDSTLFYSYEHLKKYNRFFERDIVAIKANKKTIYCLVRYEKKGKITPMEKKIFSLITINRKNGKTTEKVIPSYPGFIPISYGLRKDRDTIMPFGLYRKDGNYMVRTFK